MMPSAIKNTFKSEKQTMKNKLCAFTFRDAKTGGIIEVTTELNVLHAKNIALDKLNEVCPGNYQLKLIDVRLTDD